jgi:hypothetical protein
MKLCSIIWKVKEGVTANILPIFTPHTLSFADTLRYSPKWKQVSAKLTGDNKARSIKTLHETGKGFDGAKRKQPEGSWTF